MDSLGMDSLSLNWSSTLRDVAPYFHSRLTVVVFKFHFYVTVTTRQSLNKKQENGEKSPYSFNGFQEIYSASEITMFKYTLQLLSNLN